MYDVSNPCNREYHFCRFQFLFVLITIIFLPTVILLTTVIILTTVIVLTFCRLLHPVTSAPVQVGSTVSIAIKDMMSDCSVTVWTAVVDEKDSTRTFPGAAIAAKMSEDLKAFYDDVVEKMG